MRIAKPLLLVSTPLGVVLGLYEGWRLTGGLVLLMALMMGIVTAGVASIVQIVRRERRALEAAAAPHPAPASGAVPSSSQEVTCSRS